MEQALIKKIESSAHGKFHSSVEFRSIPEIAFRSDDFQWIGIQKFHGGDGNDSLKAGRPSDDNLWREYAYRVTLKNTKYTDHANKIYRGVLVDYSIYRSSYLFGVINNGFYAFSGYLWPNNLFDEHNVELPNASPLVNGDYNEYIMRIEGAPERKTIIHNSEGTLFLSLLCAFGASFKFGYAKTPLFVGIYDQYGNYGTICVDPDLLPDRYISSSEQNGLQSLIFFSDMMDKRPTYEQNEYYVYIRNASQKYPRNACLINLIGILEMLAPENQSASTTELNCLFKIISNKESETDVVSIYLETFNKPELKLYINCLGLLCLSSVIPGSKLQISPQWSNCSTCIADENYITYLAFTSDEHGLHVYQIQMLDNLYIDPSDWPQPPPYTLGFAGFEWLFLPDKSLVI